MKLKIENMNCGHCEMNIKKIMTDLGIASIVVNLENKELVASNEVTTEKVTAALADKGYNAEVVNENCCGYGCPDCI